MAHPTDAFNRSAVIKFQARRPETRRRSELRPTRRKLRLRFRPGRLLLTALILYGLAVFGTQEIRVHQLKVSEAGVRSQIKRLQEENQALREQIRMTQSDAYIEKVARERLGLVKAGEIPYYNGVPGDPGRLRTESGY